MFNGYFFVLVPILNILLCFGLGVFVLTRDFRSAVNIGFTLGLMSLVCIELGNAVVMGANSREMLSLGLKLGALGQLFLPPAWLLFSATFARKTEKRVLLKWGALVILFTLISLSFALFINSPNFFRLPEFLGQVTFSSNEGVLLLLGEVGHYCYLYLIIGILVSLVLLENTFRFSTGEKRWQIKYIVLGTGSILFFFIYYFSQVMLFSSINIELIRVLSFVILFSVALLTVFIVRHRLLNVDIFVSRYIVYNSVTILIVGIYFVVVGLIIHGIRYFNFPFTSSLSTLVVFVAIFLLFVLGFSTSVRRKIQLFLNRHFYKHKYEFRDKWMESIERISSKTSAREISQTLIEMISETMGAKNAYLWIYNPTNKTYSIYNNFSGNEYAVLQQAHPVIEFVKRFESPFSISEKLNEIEDKDVKIFFELTQSVLCSPLNGGGENEGFVVLGQDISGESYRSDDFELLTALTTQVAVQLRNIYLSEELVTVKEVDMFNKMSSFIMHDLKNLTNSLSLVSQNAAKNIDNPEFQKDAIRTIDNTVVRMRGLIEKLSTAPRSIELKKEPIDIKKMLHTVIKKVMNVRESIRIVTDIKDMPFLPVDPHSIEMVLVNLLANAYDAIKNDGVITINACMQDNRAKIAIKDTGTGMKKEFIERYLFKPFNSSKKNGFGIGLYQSKIIIESHGGEIEVESVEGEGTTFTIKLPLQS